MTTAEQSLPTDKEVVQPNGSIGGPGDTCFVRLPGDPENPNITHLLYVGRDSSEKGFGCLAFLYPLLGLLFGRH